MLDLWVPVLMPCNWVDRFGCACPPDSCPRSAFDVYLCSCIIILCYFTGIFHAVVSQISMLFIDNKDSVFCIFSPAPCWFQKDRGTDTLGRCQAWSLCSATGRTGPGWSRTCYSRTWQWTAAAWRPSHWSPHHWCGSAGSSAAAWKRGTNSYQPLQSLAAGFHFPHLKNSRNKIWN